MLAHVFPQFKECTKPHWIGDGFCDDLTNNFDCDFDGGDCCGPKVNQKYCKLCTCHQDWKKLVLRCISLKYPNIQGSICYVLIKALK